MGAVVSRLWFAFNPPLAVKRSDALRFGILGAANIAPLALVIPARSHPDVVVQAIAARDRKRAEEFAKKHGIPDVRDSYQEILDDPAIDCVLIPLPNSLHFEWAVRALRAGKHVLLEKPSVSNAVEAEILFNLPELSQPGAPVLLEAFHNRFHPAVALFRSFFNPADVVHADTANMIPWWATGKDDIAFQYKLAGGCMSMMGTYNFAMLRTIFGSEPEECLHCETKSHEDGVRDKCDHSFEAKFLFPGGGIGEARSTLYGPTIWKPSHATVITKQVVVPDKTLPTSQEKLRSREVTMRGFLHAVVWNRITVRDSYEIRSKADGKSIKKWQETASHNAYSFREAGGQFADLPGESWWMSYRWQLEAFVNRVRGRETQYWISPEDSINNMRMIDMAYEKSGLGIRPTSTFRP